MVAAREIFSAQTVCKRSLAACWARLGTGFPSKRAQRRSEDHHLEHEAEDREHFGEKQKRKRFPKS